MIKLCPQRAACLKLPPKSTYHCGFELCGDIHQCPKRRGAADKESEEKEHE